MSILFGGIILIIGAILFAFGGEDSRDLARVFGIDGSKSAVGGGCLGCGIIIFFIILFLIVLISV